MSLTIEPLIKKSFWASLFFAVFIPVIIISFVLIKPGFKKTSILKEQLNEAKKVQDLKEGEVKAGRESLSVLKNLSGGDVQKLLELLPASRETEEFFQMLEDKAQENGFVLKSVEINDSAAKEVKPPRTALLQGTANFVGGDYSAFKNLLKAIEKSARIIDISSINFVSGTGSYAINFKTYWLENAAGAALTIDQQFFEDSLFKILVSDRQQIEIEPKGNANPFIKH